MTTVGIVTIALGVIVGCSRGALLVAPEAVLRWFLEIMETKGRVRVLGAIVVALGAVTIWAGASEESTLATILSVMGWAFLAVSVPLLVLFPGAYQAIAKAVLKYKSDMIQYTVSIGLASYKADSDDTLDDLLANADIALYQAKNSGRNRTTVFGDQDEQAATA